MSELKPVTMAFIGTDEHNVKSVCIALKDSSIIEMDGELVAGVALNKQHAIQLADILLELAQKVE